MTRKNRVNRRTEFRVLLLICLTLFLFVPATCAQEQYKKQNRDAISQIVDGKYDDAIPDPQVTYKIINIDNEVIYTFSLNRSQLTHKKAK